MPRDVDGIEFDLMRARGAEEAGKFDDEYGDPGSAEARAMAAVAESMHEVARALAMLTASQQAGVMRASSQNESLYKTLASLVQPKPEKSEWEEIDMSVVEHDEFGAIKRVRFKKIR